MRSDPRDRLFHVLIPFPARFRLQSTRIGARINRGDFEPMLTVERLECRSCLTPSGLSSRLRSC